MLVSKECLLPGERHFLHFVLCIRSAHLPATPCATAKALAARGREASVTCAKASATEREARPAGRFSHYHIFPLAFCNFVKPLKISEYIMGVWKQLQEYFYLKKRDPNAPLTPWMRYMHGINRISLFMFLIALIVIVIKLVTAKK